MNNRLGWILPVPFLILGAGVWIYFQTQNEVRAQMDRAQAQWRQKNYAQSVQLYEAVYQNYPESRYADEALWEMATIYYVNFYDIDRAVSCFGRLVSEYPDSPLRGEAYLKLAEMYEMELEDLPRALQCLEGSLDLNASLEVRQQRLYRMGDLHLKLDQFDEALRRFQLLVDEKGSGHLAEQALARMGTILQIKREYERSVEYFQRVLRETHCSECRLTARLGLVENYEFLGEIGKAIDTARAIPDSEYPEELRRGLLKRLDNKARYYTSPLLE